MSSNSGETGASGVITGASGTRCGAGGTGSGGGDAQPARYASSKPVEMIRSQAGCNEVKFIGQGLIEGPSKALAGAKTERHTVPQNTKFWWAFNERK